MTIYMTVVLVKSKAKMHNTFPFQKFTCQYALTTLLPARASSHSSWFVQGSSSLHPPKPPQHHTQA